MNIREVVDQYHDTQDKLKQWVDETLTPKLEKCKSSEEVLALAWETAQEFGGNEVDYRHPSIVRVRFAIYGSKFIERERNNTDNPAR